ncbi:zinc finger, CCHC-type containing protein [Tanacetum coccineum]
MKDMTSKVDKLAKFEGQDFRRCQNKMHFLLTTLKVVYVLSTPSPVWYENEILETTRKRMKWENNDYICRGHILNESKYMAKDASVKKFLVSNFMNYKMVDTRPVMEQYHEMLRILGQYTQHNLMRDEAILVAVIIDKLPPSWKEFKHGLKHKKEKLNLVQLGSHLRIEEGLINQELDNNPKEKNQIGSSSVNMVEGDGSKNSNNNKNKRKFKSGDDKFANKKATVTCWKCKKTIHMKKDCRSRKGNDGAGSNGSKDPEKQQGYNSDFMHNFDNVLHYLSVKSDAFYVQDDEVAWWVDSVWLQTVLESDKYILSRHGSFVGFGYVCNGMIRLNLNYPLFNASACMITSSHSNSLSKSELWHARLGHIHYKRMRDMSKMSLIPAFDMTHESCKTCMLTKITRQPFKGVNRESKVLDLIHSDLCDFHANPSLENNKGGEYYDPVYFQSTSIIYQTTAPYTPQQNGVAEKKNMTLKEMVNSMLSYFGLSEGFWGEAMLTASVVRLTEPKMKNLGEKGIDCIFIGYVEHSKCYRFYVIEPNEYVSPSSRKIVKDEVKGTDDVHSPSIPRKSTRTRKAKSFGSDFQLYLVEGTSDKTLSQRKYCFIIKEDPRTLSEAMASRDVAFWKEAVQRRIDSIMHNDTWELTDLPLGCKALGCKWILKRKMKVDRSIDKYKARLIIQGFRQKEEIDFFDTYAQVARISTIRLLLALAAIHDLVIHQMDVKTAFLNGDLDEEIYMKQPKGFVMLGHESKVCKLKKSLYGLKQAPKQWHQKFDDVVLSTGFSLNQADKCVYSKIDASDLGEAEVILGIRIKRGNNDPTVKFRPNKGTPVSQLECSRAIGCLMYAMISTRLDIAFAYLKGTMDYGLTYSGYPSVIEGYSDASWINNMEDHSSTSGWVFLLGGGAISWASKKQTCITSSTMESEFVALAAAGNEAEWLRNLIYEIPLWPKPISTISIRCDSAATLAKAYSQVYNGKSRHLGVRHSMIRELIMNGVISVEFVKTQLNLADHLTKGLARDLVRKAAIGMGLKST